MTVGMHLLDVTIDRETAVGLLERYLLLSRDRAEQASTFIEDYRSYIVNYGLGKQQVQTAVERAGPDQAAR